MEQRPARGKQKTRHQHPYGPPNLQIYASLIEAITKLPGLTEDQETHFDLHMANIKDKDNVELALSVRMCRVYKCYSPDLKKLMIYCHDQEHRRMLIDLLTKHESTRGQHKLGTVPRGGLEQAMESVLGTIDQQHDDEYLT